MALTKHRRRLRSAHRHSPRHSLVSGRACIASALHTCPCANSTFSPDGRVYPRVSRTDHNHGQWPLVLNRSLLQRQSIVAIASHCILGMQRRNTAWLWCCQRWQSLRTTERANKCAWIGWCKLEETRLDVYSVYVYTEHHERQGIANIHTRHRTKGAKVYRYVPGRHAKVACHYRPTRGS